MRRRDNIQAEFEAKNEALATKKVDRDTVSAILTFINVNNLADVLIQSNFVSYLKMSTLSGTTTSQS